MQAGPKKGWKLGELRQLSRTLVGQVFNNTYKILVPIGKGGMGVVFRAENIRLKNAWFAIKVLPAIWATNEINYARFKREAKILAGLHHPNIVQVIDFNKSPEGHPYLVMELLEGETLHQRLKRSSPLPRDELLAIVESLGNALQYAHDRGVIHRDLKPQNMFLARIPGAPPSVKLLDFGISKLMTSSSMVTPSQWLVMGTASYMSPEQAAGKFKDLDNRSDIFSLASITFECFTGRRPFDLPREGDSPFDGDQVLYRICHGPSEDLRLLAPDLPARVGEVLARAHAKDKDERHQRVDEFVAELTSAVSEPPPRRSRKRLLLPLVGALVAGMLVALLALHINSGGRDSSRAPAPSTSRAAPAPTTHHVRAQTPAVGLPDLSSGETASPITSAGPDQREERRRGPSGIDAGTDAVSPGPAPPSRERIRRRARARRPARKRRASKRRQVRRRARRKGVTGRGQPPARKKQEPAIKGHGPMYDEL